MNEVSCVVVVKATGEMHRLKIQTPIKQDDLLKNILPVLSLSESYEDYEIFFGEQSIKKENELIHLHTDVVILIAKRRKSNSIGSLLTSLLTGIHATPIDSSITRAIIWLINNHRK